MVTGATGTLGRGIAARFAAAGAMVALHYRSNRASADHLAESLRRAGATTMTVSADVTDPGACAAAMAEVVGAFGQLDALVNNAAIQPVQPLADMTAAQWREVIDHTLTGTFIATQAAVGVMGAGASITHIASIEASQPAHGHAHYSAAKAGVVMHARAAALEYGPRGIRVNAVSPGLIGRDGLAGAWPEGVDRWHAAAPLGRLGRAEDVGNACVFLASEMASWITGHNLVVDGGVSAHPTW